MVAVLKSRPIQRGLSLLGNGLLMLSAFGIAKANAQAPPRAEAFEAALSSADLVAQSDTLPPLRTRLVSAGSIAPIEGNVTITLRNNTASEITYEAIAATDTRILAGGEEVVLSGLNAPTTIAFYQKDGLLIEANISDLSYRDDAFTVEFNQAPDLGADDNSIVLLDSGNIFLM